MSGYRFFSTPSGLQWPYGDRGDSQWHQVLLGCAPKPDPIFEYGMRYHRECEAYDQSVCTGRLASGTAMPLDSREGRLVALNEKEVRRRLADEVFLAGLAGTPEQAHSLLVKAIQRSCRAFDLELKAAANAPKS